MKQFIAARLLSFSPDQPSDVWPWSLPEAAHFLNNTWHSTINEVPFTAFYGRESGQFGPATSGLWPDDNLYLLLLNNFSYMIQTKELNEHTTTNATDVRADQLNCLDDDYYTCNDATQCFSMESVLETASNFSSINIMRREIELSVFNATEQSSVRNHCRRIAYL